MIKVFYIKLNNIYDYEANITILVLWPENFVQVNFAAV